MPHKTHHKQVAELAAPRPQIQIPAWAPWVVLIVLVLGAYLPALACGYVWDDAELVIHNKWVTHPNLAQALRGIWTGKDALDYYPLTATGFLLQWRIWGNSPSGFHAVNILLHTINVLLVWRILRRLRLPAAWVVAAVYAVHPVGVESVAWIAEQKNTLAMALFLLSTLAWVHYLQTTAPAKRRLLWSASFLAFGLALLAKTSVVMLPLVLVLIAWHRLGRIRWRDVAATAPFFAAALLLGVITVRFMHAQAVDPLVKDLGLLQRIAQAGVNLWFYLYKTLFPIDLATVYPEARLPGLSVVAFLPLVAWLAALAATWHYRQKPWAGAAFFVLAFFTINLAPVLGVIRISWTAFSPVADHYAYIAMLSIIAGVVTLVWDRLQHGAAPRQAAAARILAWACTALILLILLGLTWNQIPRYRSAVDFWAYNAAQKPTSPHAHSLYGLALRDEGYKPEAAAAFAEAVRVEPRMFAARLELGKTLLDLGHPRDAAEAFKTVLADHPDHLEAFVKLAQARWRMGDIKGAEEMIASAETRAAALPSGDARAAAPMIQYERAQLLEATNRPADAIPIYADLAKTPDYRASASFGLGNCLSALNRPAEAVDAYRQTLAADPRKADAWLHLALALRSTGNQKEADEALRTAITLNPQLATPRPQPQP